jgi:hydroxymethylpyrimidine kinase/phosphomethylpyrimidine kinase
VPRFKQIPCALTIAGSDSGGGAGIQADLMTFSALGVHGATAITCLTAQNPARVLGVEPVSPQMVCRQLEAVFSELRPKAAKTGMLFSAACIRAVARFLQQHPIPLVVDPVMVSTSGARLLQAAGLRALAADLLPQATLITPNLAEAEMLTGERLGSPEDLRDAARTLQRRFGAAILVKGGHLRGCNEAVDIFYDGKQELLLRAPFLRGIRSHGTGCTYSAAVTAYLASGLSLVPAVVRAKEFVTRTLVRTRKLGRHQVLGWRPA